MATKLVNGKRVEMTAEEVAALAQDLPPVVPASVSMAQARKALILSGISIASVDAAIAAIEDATTRDLAATDWEYSTSVRRSSPLVDTLGTALGLTSEQIDALFLSAGTL